MAESTINPKKVNNSLTDIPLNKKTQIQQRHNINIPKKGAKISLSTIWLI